MQPISEQIKAVLSILGPILPRLAAAELATEQAETARAKIEAIEGEIAAVSDQLTQKKAELAQVEPDLQSKNDEANRTLEEVSAQVAAQEALLRKLDAQVKETRATRDRVLADLQALGQRLQQ